MDNLQVFSYADTPVRTVQQDGETWFVLSDICKVLGLSNATVLANRLDEDERSKSDLGRQGEAIIINESGLYSVILRSDKPEARPFRKWVTSEVLPSIRKTGTYSQRPMTQLELLAAQAQAMVEMEQKVNAIEQRQSETERQIQQTAAIFTAPAVSRDDWQIKMHHELSEIASEFGLNHGIYRGKLYEQLEDVASVNLTMRVGHLKRRLKRAGATYKEQQAVNKLAVIANDPKLREIFTSLVRQDRAQRTFTPAQPSNLVAIDTAW